VHNAHFHLQMLFHKAVSAATLEDLLISGTAIATQVDFMLIEP